MLLGWIINFFALTVVASLFGFYALDGLLATIAQFLAVVFFSLLSISLLYGLVSVRKSRHRAHL